ncbi:MAG: hypothetical protein ICV68_17680 [Pyrinomonadaceae bacterium]|nr:hypothetical protein [Pyrinomonadaceae bacterium]
MDDLEQVLDDFARDNELHIKGVTFFESFMEREPWDGVRITNVVAVATVSEYGYDHSTVYICQAEEGFVFLDLADDEDRSAGPLAHYTGSEETAKTCVSNPTYFKWYEV